MADDTDTASAIPTLEDWQHWTWVMGRAQQMLMETWADGLPKDAGWPAAASPWGAFPPAFPAGSPMTTDPAALFSAGAEAWAKGLETWGKMIGLDPEAKENAKDRRFAAPEWQESPVFDTIRKTYLALSDKLLGTAEELDGLDDESRHRLMFAVRSFVDAMSPSNFALTNPQVLKRTMETRGENLLKGLANMLDDIAAGQLTQTKQGVFEVGRNLATTPGKVIKETPLYQLIQYTPTTDEVLETPLVIFPPWINRFYILDLTPEKSFVKWCVDQGISLFMVSWKSADESIADATLDDYVLNGQIDAIDTVRDLLGVESVHTIGYCVAGTTLAATLAYLTAHKQQSKVKSATFLTAQVDFSSAGDLKLFTGADTVALLDEITRDSGYLDGRYMAATFNLLRGRDLIWSYVVNNYLMGDEPAPFDLLHWNSDTTNLPASWHRDYIESFYKGNKLAEKGGINVAGTAVDIDTVKTPTYVQAGREDHISPPESVWKIMGHFTGPKRFVLAGSGHIAGVVNPPAAEKYQHWTNNEPADTLETFIAGAEEHKGSWWPDWLAWLKSQDPATVPANGARVPGKGKLKPIEDAPGRYVKAR
ncbi:class I poly(R)-hydroxyalkanoic acid synthase (plasmid) [Sphingomonas daechungensis]|uniref:Class I poly(R)-hydroxyalkanoic acid synthase n=1 Tax=Sphingomonas daechungensis TaxID=1176646 RepID=A0ABX6T4C6_9SPHN|nr:class I poly(R)-hydroxyalkanoic acid synthase [Sphingomonas daechungensis]QNP44635.1 class I poly(R)-hydroxyalkanoic acid synthase [Sphingomonas daechungensis]